MPCVHQELIQHPSANQICMQISEFPCEDLLFKAKMLSKKLDGNLTLIDNVTVRHYQSLEAQLHQMVLSNALIKYKTKAQQGLTEISTLGFPKCFIVKVASLTTSTSTLDYITTKDEYH